MGSNPTRGAKLKETMKTVIGTLTYVTGSDEFFFELEDGSFVEVRFVDPETEVLLNTKIALSVRDISDMFDYYRVPDITPCYQAVEDA